MAEMRMLSQEIFRLQNEISSMRPGTDEYTKAIEELQKLQQIENDESRIRIDEDRVTNDRLKIQTDDLKSRRDERREYVKIGSSIIGGGGLICLVQLLESEKVIHSKAWQFAAKVVNKFL